MSLLNKAFRPLTLLLLICLHVSAVVVGEVGAQKATVGQTGAQEISVGNLTSNVRSWRKDMAVMFYAPWCKYCKQLKPSWDQIAKVSSEAQKSMEVGIFDCDTESANTELCQALGVDRYPSVYFIGYGDFNQAKKGNLLGKSEFPRLVKYTADLYPDRIYDWMLMLNGISTMQRGVDNVKGAFTKNAGTSKRLADVEGELANADYRMRLYADELQRYKADEIFKEMDDLGDPFPLLAQIDTSDAKTLPLRVCIVEHTNEYCVVHQNEPYCKTFRKYCTKTNKEAMVPEVCRPEVCPLPALGCRVVSSCLSTDTISRYQKALAERAA